MSIESQFGTNTKKEAEGVEIPLSPNKDGTVPTFIVAATSRSNTPYAKSLEKATKPFRRAGKVVGLDDAVADKLYKETFCKTVLKGWRNVQVKDENGELIVLVYNYENAVKLMNDFPRLYDYLSEEAGSIERFQDEVREEEAKN